MENEINIHKLRAERFQKAIKESDYTQKEVAKELNYSEAAISSYCKGTRDVSIEAAYKLSQLLGIRVEYLMGEDDYKTTYEAYQAAIDYSQPAWLLSEFIGWCGVKTDFEIKNVDEMHVEYCLENGYRHFNTSGKKKPIARYVGCEFTTPDGAVYQCNADQLEELIRDVYEYAEMRIQKKLKKKP